MFFFYIEIKICRKLAIIGRIRAVGIAYAHLSGFVRDSFGILDEFEKRAVGRLSYAALHIEAAAQPKPFGKSLADAVESVLGRNDDAQSAAVGKQSGSLSGKT